MKNNRYVVLQNVYNVRALKISLFAPLSKTNLYSYLLPCDWFNPSFSKKLSIEFNYQKEKKNYYLAETHI